MEQTREMDMHAYRKLHFFSYNKTLSIEYILSMYILLQFIHIVLIGNKKMCPQSLCLTETKEITIDAVNILK